ncbi:hypothetical protein D1007_14054 [Hordeum vulgare]|nr:hypothetical protein D1007_14054 [Hordeum vulgare]
MSLASVAAACARGLAYERGDGDPPSERGGDLRKGARRWPAARRKTLTGVWINSSAGGISLQRVRHHVALPEAVPVAKMAERLVYRTLGITRDDEDVTDAIIDAFTAKFKEHLSLK